MAFIKFSVPAPDVKSTLDLAAALAREADIGDCILLRGDLGAGKTTFARGFIQALYPHEKNIISPTFTLVQIYSAPGVPPIWHFDFYRLNSKKEVAEIGLEDALHLGVTLIEWPELMENDLPGTALDVTIAITSAAGGRMLTFVGSPAWQARLDALKEPLE